MNENERAESLGSAFFCINDKEMSMRNSRIGGQAVIEGVMMKNENQYAVAVRKTNQNIEVTKGKQESLTRRYKLAAMPIIRGAVIFAETLIMGIRTLNDSVADEEIEEAGSKNSEKKESIWMGVLLVLAIIAAIGFFVVVPFLISESLRRVIRFTPLRGLLEGVIRVLLFILYVKLISLMDDIKRVFMYHGAEHKSINCIENGLELTVCNVKKQSLVHKRCGTSFMLVVMLVSILFFMFISVGALWLRMLFRILLIPVIAGLSYEFIQFAGNHEGAVISALSKPGFWLQGLTTAEPTEDMIEVAIASVDAVFDWRTFVADIKDAENIVIPDTTLAAANEESPGGALQGAEVISPETSEEEDEILNALDRFFVAPEKEEKS